MTAQVHETDVVIIGAGPVGIFAVFQCGMMKLRCHVIDSLEIAGGQCAALYPEKPIYDIPAFPKIDAGDLIKNLLEQAHPFEPVYHLSQQVEKIERLSPELWQVTTSQNTVIQAKVIIIAAGVGAFGPHKPPLNDLELYEDTHIHYYVKSKERYRNKRVVIAGGGDSAVDWALSLSEIASKLYVVHRREKFRAAPESLSRLTALAEQGKLELVIPYQLAALCGEERQLQSVIVESFEGERRELSCDFLLPFFGLSMNLGPIATWGLNLDHQHIAVDPSTCATSTRGIFAIGDVATYKNKLKLILTGFSEAAQAAHQAREIVHPGEVWHFEYSTTSGIPKVA
jgi:thioredoxin reductase (NADPH)